MTDAGRTHELERIRIAHLESEDAGPGRWPSLPPLLRERIGFLSTSRGDCGEGDVYGFNLGLHVGDDPRVVHNRRELLARSYGIRPVWMQQVHGTDCLTVDPTDAPIEVPGHPSQPSPAAVLPVSHADAVTADAAFCAHAGISLVVMTADCLPVLLTDAQGRAVAAAHCGWRGLLGGVLENTVERFRQHGLLDQHVYVWMGPCIGPNSFEVGEDVRNAFVERDAGTAGFFRQRAGTTGKWLADLQSIAHFRLRQVCDVVVDADRRDTFTSTALNSFRRTPVTGRQASLIWLKAGVDRPGAP